MILDRRLGAVSLRYERHGSRLGEDVWRQAGALEKLTSNPLKAVLLGAGVTAVIQSSSATTVMVVGFVNSGIMKLSQAIGIIMGANIGTTITAWLLSLTGIEGRSFHADAKAVLLCADPCACRHYFYHERQERQEATGLITWVYGVDDGNGHDERGGKAACGCAGVHQYLNDV